MIDNLALALTHGLLALAAWRLLLRGDLDSDPGGNASGCKDAAEPHRKPGPRA